MTFKAACSLFALFATQFLSAEVIADYSADFSLKKLKPGWAYQWNPENVNIDQQDQYIDLEVVKNYYAVDADYPPSKKQNKDAPHPDGKWLTARRNSVSCGYGTIESQDQLNHYVILSYTVQPGEAGSGRIINSEVLRKNETGSNEIRIYVNDRLIGTDILKGVGKQAFNVELGLLEVSDTVYLALGPNGKRAGAVNITFQIDTE
ncbi:MULTISPECIES: hypothetical protein [unclassified Lentimonas]|uniref:hypothetical protein n=1 Tax=unclassified Lentimonas TaxID=2630993 RepID=UPI0013298937|nr:MULTISPECIES: hypothetical protein [unclassified Lentimonas]CAA6679193.1 Unannotated [Lentimonas sp. CC4]CAA6684063.1 Unannotated [Lentimonas sp. CC6]CAA6689823.1 Unannotated [Lentimonas sp. CC10]CAA6694834.1 Unannotated [Lentimonas sp. CC19]CAA7069477.1 Unannotated [Lentimonas sp. CC11]